MFWSRQQPQLGSSSQPQPPPSSSPVEQAILNLSKVVGNFVEDQKGINVQLALRIDTVESTLNKRIEVSRPDSRPDPIGGSEPVSETRDSRLGLFFFFLFI